MHSYLIKRLVVLGGLAIAGIILMQSFWMFKSWDLKDQEFHQTVSLALRDVAESIALFNKSELPKQDIVQRRSSNYYAVNINDVIDANVLEDYLIQEFEERSLNTDFEYAVYDCQSDDLVYGNYCEVSDDGSRVETNESLPKLNDLVYYFVVRFPSRNSFLLRNLWQSVLFSFFALLACIFFIYSIWVILRQKRLSELQKDFINNMTHEFKTPISSIKIASEVLASAENVQSDKRLSKYAQIITDQNKRLNDQVEKVLNIARIEKNEFELKLENINLQEDLKRIIESESIRVKKLYGSIKTDFAADGVEITADHLHFSNMVTNIIDNAIKYSSEKPQITIATKVQNRHVLLSISDKGIGIDKEHQSRLFDRFFRVHTGNKHDVKGFGLGLFYVKRVCQSHSWDVEVDSELGKGTTIIFKIPKL